VGSFFASFLVVSDLSYGTIGVVLGVLNIACAVVAHTLPDTTGKNSLICILCAFVRFPDFRCSSVFVMLCTGKRLDDVNARTMYKSGSSQDYALIDMTTSIHNASLHGTSLHSGALSASPLHSTSSSGSNSAKGGVVHSTMHHNTSHTTLRAGAHSLRSYSSEDV